AIVEIPVDGILRQYRLRGFLDKIAAHDETPWLRGLRNIRLIYISMKRFFYDMPDSQDDRQNEGREYHC
ncbi:MAG: hypothetical protein KDH97_23185, partial [Calditrichaeota bacterium]|nr:hypothetical protein [Calditrichota bacterium]